jgi:hypothetical protein
LDKLAAVAMETKKGGFKKKIGFLSSNFMKLCRNIHCSVWQLLGVEKIQNGGCCHGNPEFAKLHMGLVVLVKKMSVLINFLLQNTNLVSVLSKICPNFAGQV